MLKFRRLTISLVSKKEKQNETTSAFLLWVQLIDTKDLFQLSERSSVTRSQVTSEGRYFRGSS